MRELKNEKRKTKKSAALSEKNAEKARRTFLIWIFSEFGIKQTEKVFSFRSVCLLKKKALSLIFVDAFTAKPYHEANGATEINENGGTLQ